MAFKNSQIEPVEFGDKKCAPELDAERKLRLQRIQFSTAELEKKADEIIASCFPDDEAFVLDYLAKCPVTAKSRLATYLIGGEETVKAIEKAYQENIAEAMKGAKND